MTEMNDYDENTEDSAVDDEEAKAAEVVLIAKSQVPMMQIWLKQKP